MSFNKYSKKHWIRMNKIAWQNKKINDNLKGTFYWKNIQQKKIRQKKEPTVKKIMTKKRLSFSTEEKRILLRAYDRKKERGEKIDEFSLFKVKMNSCPLYLFFTEHRLNQWRHENNKIKKQLKHWKKIEEPINKFF